VPAVVLMTAFQHPHPCFLEQVFGDGAIRRQAHQVPQQPMLVLLDETIQQVRVSPAEPSSDRAGLGLHPVREAAGGRVHPSAYTGERPKKTHGDNRHPPTRAAKAQPSSLKIAAKDPEDPLEIPTKGEPGSLQ
jgi:hypothetical protein